MDTLNQILSSPAIGTIGLVVSTIGVIVSVYFYRKSKREKTPCWAIRTNVLVEESNSKIPDIEIIYKGQPVENVSVSKVMFWNQGAETINRPDIVSSSPLRIVGQNGAKLLDVAVIRSNCATNLFSASIPSNENACLLDFEYLDQSQGAIIQIIHTGTSSDDLAIAGAIKGVKNIHQKSLRRFKSDFVARLPLSRFKPSTRQRILALSFISLGIVFIVFWLAIMFSSIFNGTDKSPVIDLIMGVITIIMASYILIYDNIRTLFAVPSGLEDFDE